MQCDVILFDKDRDSPDRHHNHIYGFYNCKYLQGFMEDIRAEEMLCAKTATKLLILLNC